MIRSFHIDRAKGVRPVLPDGIESFSCGCASFEASDQPGCLVGVFARPEPEDYFAFLVSGQIEPDLNRGARVQRRPGFARESRTVHCGGRCVVPLVPGTPSGFR